MRSDDVKAWAKRWEEVERAEIDELRRMPVELKLRQLEALARSASVFDWAFAEREDEAVREVWMTLRRQKSISTGSGVG